MNTSVEDYIDAITSEGTPLDFIGITVLSRIYHFHVGVFMKNGVWTTAHNVKEQNILFTLVFHSNFDFSETVRNGQENNYNDWLAHRKSLGKMPSHVKCELNVEALYERRSEESQEEEDHDNDVQEANEAQQSVKSEVTVLPTNYDVFSSEVTEHSSHLDDSGYRQEENSELVNETENIQDTENSACANIGTENSAENSASEFELAQAAFHQYSEENSASSKRILISCPVELCDFNETTQLAINQHLSDVHPDFRFQCRSCPKTFLLANSRYKHEREHTNYSLYCGECGKGFHFKSELERHIGVHNDILPFPCEECDRRFAAKKTLTRHLQEHSEKVFQCDMCDKVCPSNDKLYTHFRGAHGKGYTAPCGFWTQWPGKRARHQIKCDPCIEFLAIKSGHKQPVQFKSDAKKIKLENIKTETVVKQEPKVKKRDRS